MIYIVNIYAVYMLSISIYKLHDIINKTNEFRKNLFPKINGYIALKLTSNIILEQ